MSEKPLDALSTLAIVMDHNGGSTRTLPVAEKSTILLSFSFLFFNNRFPDEELELGLNSA